MGVGDEDVRHADRHVGTAADVQHDSELADAEVGLMTGARAALNREVLGGDREEIFIDQRRHLPTSRMRAAMDVRVIRDIDTLTALQQEWLDLWRRSPDATPFQS